METADGIYMTFLVPIKSFDNDSGSEFINQYFRKYRDERKIIFTQSRTRCSNDNCFVEQKNGDVIRKIVEYFRHEGDDAFSALKKVYSYFNLLINYLYPTKKTLSRKHFLMEKLRKYLRNSLKCLMKDCLNFPLFQSRIKTGNEN